MFDRKIVNSIIRERRMLSPIAFTGEEIPKSDIVDLLENANWAPSHRNTEPWRFKVYSGLAKDHFAEAIKGLYKNHTLEQDFKPKKADKIISKAKLSSHLIIINMQRHPEKLVPEWEEIAAVSCAVQNLWISACAYGYGGYWSSPAFLTQFANEIMNLSTGERCLGLFYLGVPNPGLRLNKTKLPLEDKIEWIE